MKAVLLFVLPKGDTRAMSRLIFRLHERLVPLDVQMLWLERVNQQRDARAAALRLARTRNALAVPGGLS